MTDIRNFVMIGAGGTASHLIHPLIAYLQGTEYVLHLYDADTVEPRNLSRQLFYPHEVGQQKATILSLRFPDTTAAHIEYIGPDNIDSAIREGDTVLICADNMFVRRLVNEKAKTLQDILIINGGNEEYTFSAQVFQRINGKNVTPSLDFYSPEFDVELDDDRSALSCAQIAELPGGEQTIVANNGAASFMLQALMRCDHGTYTLDKQWTKITCDIVRGTVQTSDVRLIGGLDG